MKETYLIEITSSPSTTVEISRELIDFIGVTETYYLLQNEEDNPVVYNR